MALPRRSRPLALAAIVATVAAAGCGGDGSDDPVQQVPEESGLRSEVAGARTPTAGDFPNTNGMTLQELANSIGGAVP